MTFSEDVTLGAGYLKVVDSKSNIVSNGDGEGSTGRNVTVPLKSGLADGSYIVSYRITSADSHPIGGAYAFVVGDGPLVAATGSVVGGGTNGVITKIFDVARFVGFLGVVLLGRAGLRRAVLAGRAHRPAGPQADLVRLVGQPPPGPSSAWSCRVRTRPVPGCSTCSTPACSRPRSAPRTGGCCARG